jgi:hypothetical protein
MDDTKALTWDQLVRLEPGLGQLRLDCRFADRRDPDGFDAEAVWNGTVANPGLKQRLENLVGAKAVQQDTLLLSLEAYELAAAECHQALPPSRPGNGRSTSQASQPSEMKTGPLKQRE